MFQIVKLALAEKGVPYEDRQINFYTREHKSPEYMKLQPFGVVPVLDDDGFIIYGNFHSQQINGRVSCYCSISRKQI